MRFFRTFRACAWHGPLYSCALALSIGCGSGELSAQGIPLPARNPAPTAPAPGGPALLPPAKNAPKGDAVEPEAKTAAKDEQHEVILNLSVRFVETRPADAPLAASEEERVAEQLGRLVFARVDIEVEGATLRDVLRAVRKALGINLVVFEQKTQAGTVTSGVDGSQVVDFALTDTDGYGVLDTLASLATGDCTWQINRGIVEFGPKSQLARVDARRTEVVEAADLSLIPPDYQGQMGKTDIQSYNRLDTDEVLADLIRAISTHCEPDAFDPDPERTYDAYPTGSRQIVPVNPEPGKTRVRVNPSTNAWRNLDPRIGPVYIHGKWASIQTKNTQLMLVAPDFVMRKVIGYPKPLPPREQAATQPSTQPARQSGEAIKP